MSGVAQDTVEAVEVEARSCRRWVLRTWLSCARIVTIDPVSKMKRLIDRQLRRARQYEDAGLPVSAANRKAQMLTVEVIRKDHKSSPII